MPKGVPKTKPASKYFLFDAAKYLNEPNITGSPETTKLDQLKARRLKRRLAKIEEMEANMYLSEVEDELKKKQVKHKKTEAANTQSDELVKGLIEKPEVQQQWINMDPQQRSMLMATISAVKSKGGETTSSLGGMLPFLMLQMQKKPDTNVTEMVQLINAVRPPQQPQVSIKDIIDLQKNSQSQQSQANVMKDVFSVLKPIYEQVSEKDRQLLQSQIANPLDTLKEMKAFSETMGFTGQQNPNLQLEIERMRGDRELKIEELRQQRLVQERQFSTDQQNRAWDREDSKQRWEMIGNAITGPIGNLANQFGSAGADRIRTGGAQPNQQVKKPPQIPNPVPITCPNCNKQFIGSSDAVAVNCPHCGTQLRQEKVESVADSQPAKQPSASKDVKPGMDGSKVS